MRRAAAVVVAALALAGCATYDLNDGGDAAGLIAANYRAADVLVEIGKGQLDPDKPIIVATVVDIDDLERSSTLGRYVSESVSARFTQKGYRMVEMKFQNSVYMKKAEGELMLTRQIREIANAHRAQAVIVGTYSRASSTVFVNLKVVRPESNVAIAASDYSVRVTPDVCALLYRDPKACSSDRW